jgi:hypothetical protein
LRRSADAVAFWRMFIANPDLPQRIRAGVPLNAFDRSTAYGGGAHGYSCSPLLAPLAKAAGPFFCDDRRVLSVSAMTTISGPVVRAAKFSPTLGSC